MVPYYKCIDFPWVVFIESSAMAIPNAVEGEPPVRVAAGSSSDIDDEYAGLW